MKTRQGFVSNSSSSSFVIGFDKKPESAEEMRQILFPNRHEISAYGDSFPSSQVAETVFNDIKDKEPLPAAIVASSLSSGEFPGKPQEPDIEWNDPSYDAVYSKYEELCDDAAIKHYDTHYKHLNKVFFEVEHSDDDGTYGSTLEHGDIFSNITHIRVSQH